jgi:predicted N-acetyltransferase YhbS
VPRYHHRFYYSSTPRTNTHAGAGLGRIIINKLVAAARELGCYKIILDCEKKNVPFYEKLGFMLGHSPVCMARYFESKANL